MKRFDCDLIVVVCGFLVWFCDFLCYLCFFCFGSLNSWRFATGRGEEKERKHVGNLNFVTWRVLGVFHVRCDCNHSTYKQHRQRYSTDSY